MPVLSHGRMRLARDKHQTWFATVESTTTLDDLIEHEFWKHNCARVMPFDEIKVYPQDGKWRATMHVINSDEVGLDLDVIEFTKFRRVEEMQDEEGRGLVIKPAGPGKGFNIHRSDGAIFPGGMSRDEARQKLKNLSPSFARSA